jgi:hypothetical protein
MLLIFKPFNLIIVRCMIYFVNYINVNKETMSRRSPASVVVMVIKAGRPIKFH